MLTDNSRTDLYLMSRSPRNKLKSEWSRRVGEVVDDGPGWCWIAVLGGCTVRWLAFVLEADGFAAMFEIGN